MKVIGSTKEFQIQESTVVTIGKFDGRHKGHQKLLQAMLELKEKRGYQTAVFTFDMVPVSVVFGGAPQMITTNEERRYSMEAMGIDYLVEYPFTPDTAQLSPEEFIKKILVDQMNAKAIVVGTDCGFGFQRAGNAHLLRQLAIQYGYEAIIIEKAQDHHRDISSTYIREELSKGNMEKANLLLGRPYSIHGVVVHGKQIGSTRLGFPTANLLPSGEKYLPPFGVYASMTLMDGIYYPGVTNIGKKPTVEGENPTGVETFLMGLDENLYGKTMEVQLFHFIRPERKFSGLEALKEQIEQDKQTAADYLRRQGLLEKCK